MTHSRESVPLSSQCLSLGSHSIQSNSSAVPSSSAVQGDASAAVYFSLCLQLDECVWTGGDITVCEESVGYRHSWRAILVETAGDADGCMDSDHKLES